MQPISPILAFGVLACAALAAAVLSTSALFIARKQYRSAHQRIEAGWLEREAKWETRLDALAQRVDALAAELRDFGQQSAHARGSTLAAGSRTGLNLTKRAQALRLHRRGDPPEQIAALLEIPVQEVDLLLKVQQIVLTNVLTNTG
jgi:hypothetical protein